jgi:hypothetical protein
VTPPPAGVAPAKLFRLLLRRPRPEIAIAHRIRGVEHIPLRVRSLSSADDSDIAEAGEGWGDAAGSAIAGEFVARALLTNDGPAFASAAEVGALDTHEAMRLALAVKAALDIISPSYTRHDVAAWGKALKDGAKDVRNLTDAIALGGCVDYALGFSTGRVVERPDRYFGLPLAEMTDGQWMAYRAARALVQEMNNK